MPAMLVCLVLQAKGDCTVTRIGALGGKFLAADVMRIGDLSTAPLPCDACSDIADQYFFINTVAGSEGVAIKKYIVRN